ncbi:MAG: hypothetical protein LH606_13020 [Cytophagaceae bacterium]|nr:hypothetical protein [Cytophagaceae bacterium]
MAQPAPASQRDPRMAALCTLAAIVFWLMNALNKDGYTTRLSYPLRVIFNDSLYIPTSALPQQVRASLSGNGWQLLWTSLSFTNRPVIYPIGMPLSTRFINTGTLTDRLTEQLKSVKVNYIIADTLDVAFEHRRTKTVVLRVDSLRIRVQRPFVVASVINVVPDRVTFEGPESVLRTLADTITIQIPANRVQADYDERLPLPYARHPMLKASTNQVSVSFEVAELLSSL